MSDMPERISVAINREVVTVYNGNTAVAMFDDEGNLTKNINDAISFAVAEKDAEIERLKAENADMRDALEMALSWFHNPEADRLEEWERIAHEFYKETGYLRPGKSWPMGEPVPDDVDSVWSDWCKRRAIEVFNAMRIAHLKDKS